MARTASVMVLCSEITPDSGQKIMYEFLMLIVVGGSCWESMTGGMTLTIAGVPAAYPADATQAPDHAIKVRPSFCRRPV